MQVSMETLRVVTTRLSHTDRVSGDTEPTHMHTVTSKSMLQAWMALEANCLCCNNRQAKHISLVKPHMRPLGTWLPWKATDQHWLEINFAHITFSHVTSITHKKTCNLIWYPGMALWLKDSSGSCCWFEELQLPVAC